MNANSQFEDPLSDIDPVMEGAYSVTDTPNTPTGQSNDVYFPDDPADTSQGNLGTEPPADAMDSGVPNISNIEFPEIPTPQVSGPLLEDGIFSDIPIKISVELGRSQLSLKEIYELCEGSIIELERLVGEPLDLVVNGQVIAQGEVVAIDNKYGLRIKTIAASTHAK